MYINVHTYYSLRYGTLKPKDLLQFAQELGIISFALTDINTTSACMDILRLAPKYNIRPVLGVDFRLGAQQQFILLAQNNHGFQNINGYLSHFLHSEEAIPPKAAPLPYTFVIYPFATYQDDTLLENEFLGVKAEDLNRLKFSPWRNRLNKLLVLHTVSFPHKKGFNIHRLLRAIANNTLLSKLPVSEQGSENDILCSPREIEATFSEFPELIRNTKELLERCSIDFDFSKETPNNQQAYTGNEDLDYRLLKKLTYGGLSYRYGNKPEEAILSRIKMELDIIQQKGFVSYFLINWKILKYARSKGYFYIGRGSGANSVIAYLLRITDVDPIELDLYFERFINLYRKNPPDFDIDFSWLDRDDITEFIFRNFKNTALLTVYNTFKYKAAIREL